MTQHRADELRRILKDNPQTHDAIRSKCDESIERTRSFQVTLRDVGYASKVHGEQVEKDLGEEVAALETLRNELNQPA